MKRLPLFKALDGAGSDTTPPPRSSKSLPPPTRILSSVRSACGSILRFLAHGAYFLTAHVPIIGIDIWEHAFYLQYHNVKADVSLPGPTLCASILIDDVQYLVAIWNVINFEEAEKRYLEAVSAAKL